MSQPDLDSGASAFFTPDHQRCDALWTSLEAAANDDDGARAKAEWPVFEAAMLRHFAMEEEVLFPALDSATGMGGGGPIAVMRHEHQQMRGLLAQMAASARAGDLQAILDQGDTLMMLIQQHNSKEEYVLYAMADQVLAPEWGRIAAMLARY